MIHTFAGRVDGSVKRSCLPPQRVRRCETFVNSGTPALHGRARQPHRQPISQPGGATHVGWPTVKLGCEPHMGAKVNKCFQLLQLCVRSDGCFTRSPALGTEARNIRQFWHLGRQPSASQHAKKQTPGLLRLPSLGRRTRQAPYFFLSPRRGGRIKRNKKG